jgi:hypothetical protein
VDEFDDRSAPDDAVGVGKESSAVGPRVTET